MTCSGCGAQTSAAHGSCAECGAPLSVTRIATGVLTPIPADDVAALPTEWGPAAPSEGSAETSFTPVEAETSFNPAVERRANPSNRGPLAPGQAFGSRYHIIRLLGVGGMGAVYHAWDAELGVAVALKVIKPEIMADPILADEVSRRFKRELLLARQVTHKNVVRIHDLGEINGIKYITMSFVEGWDLATLVQREGRFDVPRALRTARDVVSGLRAAHDAGVVHRDLKPENIMIDVDGEALIMDFGIARSTSPEPAPAEVARKSGRHAVAQPANQTMVGTIVGTVEYMAPEQARGEAVDQRADIYAFGLILYDVLVGRRLRMAPSNDALSELQRRFTSAPPPARSINPDIPEPLDAIITRCVQPDAAARYQTTAALAADFDRLNDKGGQLPFTRRVTRLQLAMSALVIVGLLTGTWGITRWLTPGPAVVQPTVSVLIADFENTTNDPVFEGSLDQALSVAMEGASFINAYPRGNAMVVAAQIKPGTTRLDETTARLVSQRDPDIKVILAGRIDKDGDGYRIGLRAVDPIPGKTLAEATRAASSKADVLQAVGWVSARIRQALGDAKSETEKLTANESFTSASLEASRDYSEAQRLVNNGRDEEALVYYERAIKQDPNMGRAYASMALSAGKLGRTAEAEALWKQALAKLDRMTERERYRTLGTYYMQVLGDDEKGIEQYLDLVRRFPADGAAHNNLANAYFNLLDFAKAREEGMALLKIYPSSVLYNYNYALYSMYAGDLPGAEHSANAAISLNPTAPPYKAFFVLAMAALARGDTAAAAAAYERAGREAGPRGASLAAIGLADLAMYQGRYADAEPLLIKGIAADQAAKNAVGAAAKHVALAEVYSAQRKMAAAVGAAQSALKLSRLESIAVPAARVFVAAGKEADARALSAELDARLAPRSRAYGKLVTGEIALHRGRIAEAVDAFRASQQFVDYSPKGANKGYWLARFDLGVAYVLAGTEQSALAFSEFETCLKRLGEAPAIFLNDLPSYRYVVPLTYWMARAQEGLSLKDESLAGYKKFLLLRPPGSGPLAADAQARTGAR